MTDKEVLPLVDSLAAIADWENAEDIAANVAEAQQRADLLILQRDYVPRAQVKVLVEAAIPFARGVYIDPYQDYAAAERGRQELLTALVQFRERP